MLRLVRRAKSAMPGLPRAVPQPVRILIVNDHTLVRVGLRMFCEQQSELTVVGEAATCIDAMAVAARTQPDVIVLDLDVVDGARTLDHLPALLAAVPRARALILASPHHPELHRQAVHCGAAGLVFKGQAPEVFLQAIRTVHAGKVWLARSLLAEVLTEQQPASSPPGAPASASLPPLTARELETVRLVASGMRNKEIAVSLGVTEGTVKSYLHNIYEKLHANGRLALTLYARDNGLV